MRDRFIRFFSTYRIFTVLFLYLFVAQAFIRSIVPLLIAGNYRLLFRLHVLALEVWFSIKATYGIVFRKSFLEEKFFGYTMGFANYLEFLLLFIEIWGIQEYRLHIKKKRLKIVDCGSGWGMSIFYFKHFYPAASIKAVEANKHTVALLRENIQRNGIANVIIQKAFVCGHGGQHLFYNYSGFDGWSITDTGAADFVGSHSGFTKSHVPSIPLSQLLHRGADVVKLDIEGMEGEALESARKELRKVSEAVIEHHPGMNRKHNTLGQIRRVLKSAGMLITVRNTKYMFSPKDALCMVYALRL